MERAKMLASCNRCSEDVGTLPVIIAELKLGDIERHVFSADLVETSDDAALALCQKAMRLTTLDWQDVHIAAKAQAYRCEDAGLTAGPF
jgi:hypothetical protein